MKHAVDLLKNACYGLLDLFTLGKGISVPINHFPVRLPARYYKYYEKDYEQESFAFFREICRPNMNIIDIGAHFGVYAVFMQKLSGGRVYSFEPTPSTLAILRKTVVLNEAEDFVEVVPAAVADQNGKATFYIDPVPGSVSNSLALYGARRDYTRGYEVDVVSLDEFFAEKDMSIDFIKIDAEGAEYAVLQGARKIIERDRPPMILGMHPAAIISREESSERIWCFLEEHHYRILYQGQPISKEAFCRKTELFDVHLIPEPARDEE